MFINKSEGTYMQVKSKLIFHCFELIVLAKQLFCELRDNEVDYCGRLFDCSRRRTVLNFVLSVEYTV